MRQLLQLALLMWVITSLLPLPMVGEFPQRVEQLNQGRIRNAVVQALSDDQTLFVQLAEAALTEAQAKGLVSELAQYKSRALFGRALKSKRFFISITRIEGSDHVLSVVAKIAIPLWGPMLLVEADVDVNIDTLSKEVNATVNNVSLTALGVSAGELSEGGFMELKEKFLRKGYEWAKDLMR